MKKKLVMALLGLTTMFVLGTSSLALGTTVDAAVYTALTPVTGDATNDNGIINANQSGLNVGTNNGTTAADVIKSDGMNYKINADGTVGANLGVTGQTTQRTHGEYQNNTNSCASCHQTHTGAADNLLFKNGIYNTCTACHDGTLGFYNVFTASTAGTFGGTAAGNASVHMATGSMEVKAAPGGNRSGTKADGNTQMENWVGEFTCASCHSPHGSYSSRLLNFNPNSVASEPMIDANGSITGTVGGNTGGQMVRGVVYAFASVPTNAGDATLYAQTPDYIAVEGTATELGVAGFVYANTAAGSTPTTLAGSDTVVVAMKKGTATFAKDTSPWISGGEFRHDHTYKVNFVNFIDPATPPAWENLDDLTVPTNPQITAGLTYNYQKGYVKNMGASLVGKQASVSRAFVLNLTMDAVAFDWFGAANSGVKITQVDPSKYETIGVQISTFCAACHTDYLAKSANQAGQNATLAEGTGVWSKAFRHTTTSASYTCLKCHFAHGTDVTVMMDAQDRGINKAAVDLFSGDTAKATEYLLDKNASSALKRYTNMSVCWKCHTSSHNVGLVNNDYVNSTKYDASTTNDTTFGTGFKYPANSALPYFKSQADVIVP